ncbi:MAG: hypothetical protein K9N46_07630 [Candidatus Marinimicrobia bacterium]|nr:hypothetical protein [Candidatus Neomarinimicrobiota bacterium]MCF7880594.1 hypothetical protein [Candidatus Neomarinimicrobiota bacterium]
MLRARFTYIWLILLLIPAMGLAQIQIGGQGQSTLKPAQNVEVSDVPNDAGDAVEISWELPEGVSADDLIRVRIYRSTNQSGPFEQVGTVPPLTNSYTDEADEENDYLVSPKETYFYKVGLYDGSYQAMSAASEGISPQISFFNWGRLNVFIILGIYFVLTLYFIRASRKGREIYIRTLPGLEALEESVGRATEMGKPVLYMPGIDEANNIQTLYSMVILRYVTQLVAEYETPLIVTVGKAFVVPLAEETVRQGYMDAGRPDLYNQDIVRYYSDEQFAAAAGVSGVILREKPATNIYLGSFYAESLILAETGFLTGSIQIAGTGNIHQLPFFVVACDYTLIGEEFYAASAYLSDDPKLLGPLKAADWMKILAIGFIGIGAILETFGIHLFSQLLQI